MCLKTMETIIMKDTSYTPVKAEENVDIIMKLTLEDDTLLFVHSDGFATDNSGKKYFCVAKDIGDDLEVLGWSSEIEKEIII